MKSIRLAGFGALVVLVSGCGSNWRESAGLVAPPPDEFLVVARNPLEMPPSLGYLPTPQLGVPSRVERDPQQMARQALASPTLAATPAQSAAEQALLAEVGPADPGIRVTLAQELPRPQRRFGLNSFFGMRIDQDPAARGQVLQGDAEAERLRAAGIAAPVPNRPANAPQ